jgi:hypothetical protein
MNRKEDCKADYCDCPCHRGKLIDGTGKRKVTHGPGQCPCRGCRHCQKRVKSGVYPDHVGRCPENRRNSEEAIAKEEEKTRRKAEAEKETKKIERDTKVAKKPGGKQESSEGLADSTMDERDVGI